MNLVSKVIFGYNINIGRFSETSNFESLDELKKYLKTTQYEKPYNLKISRDIQIIDTDIKPVKYPRLAFSVNNFPDPSIRAEIAGERLDLIVSDKLYYPEDIRKILLKKYKSHCNFDSVPHDEGRPIRFFEVINHQLIGMPMPKFNDGRYILRSVRCFPLMDKDIVVDENFNQIWPKKTGKMPDELTSLMAKTKEIIR